ncbi:MAG: aminoglycoside phosphotransferase family protein [Polyangiaceae bacterium]
MSTGEARLPHAATHDPHRALEALVQAALPGARLLSIKELGPDESPEGETTKVAGYGQPFRLVVQTLSGNTRELVFHTATANPFGHDRAPDRARSMLLAHEDFPTIPKHVEALDVGAIRANGSIVRLADCVEWYLLTSYAPGHAYALDLRRIESTKVATDADLRRAKTLATTLVEIHRPIPDQPDRYRRALRDLVGDGEGIFGIVDGYPSDTPLAPPSRLAALEQQAATYRWRLRDNTARLTRTHGDFHPFNIVFNDQDELILLDASRGAAGDPADDVVCLALNYLFFALESRGSWREGFGPLWRTFWDTYFSARNDTGLLEAAPPYVAWRALVISNPVFYPTLNPSTRDTLLSLAEHALAQGKLDLEHAESLVR